MAGLLIGKALKMRNTLNQLYDYESSIKYLEGELAKYDKASSANA